ncbi:LysR family transcriptional regulator [Cytobacillus sp. FSL W7-1323]|uniref:HTH lysR-type domain-containing protein n=1 Tax=Cytobacillus kochii TaxID=859143 RepID=A0A248TNI9_9BACI|nr:MULTISPECIES: LysR family transcriptional regulator [Cytobacillus]ASV69798.1 hypothetical protein CKF48_22310 [Cytobacillus kochii]MEA1852193.1 LysR family transcriptional regulator [Cytobacillus sp. OWB-43]
MDIKQLEVFLSVYKHNNFSKAAEELCISQPTVSSQIKSLEDQLGLQLFNRKNKSLGNLTDAGKILYPYSTQILSLVKEAEKSLTQYKEGYKGSLSLVTSDSFCYWILPKILESFHISYPTIEIILHTAFTPKMIDMLYHREVHFAIARSAQKEFIEEDLVSHHIGQDPIVLVASASNRLTNIPSPHLSDLADETFIVYGKESNYWAQIEQKLFSYGFHMKTGMELNDINATKKMIEINLGISFLPSISVQEEIENGKLQIIPISDNLHLYRHSHLVYHQDTVIAGGIQKFLSFVTEQKPYLI